MNRPVIAAIGHVAIAVADLDGAVDAATSIMGLRVTESRDGEVDLTHGSAHHSLQYLHADTDGLDHIGLVAADAAALDEILARLERDGIPIISDRPFDTCLARGFAIEGPDGFVFEIYTDMPGDEPTYAPTGVRPNRFGHVNLNAPDPAAIRDFLTAILDFRVSDDVGIGYFLRCNADHHGVAVLSGRPGLHHHAWELQSTVNLGDLADRLDQRGDSVVWGPVRHGAGRNIAVYFHEPSGAVVEYYCDMDRIDDETTFKLPVWNLEQHKWWSLWAPLIPDGFPTLGIPLAPRAPAPTAG
jgi:catechol 2,3-dioxygenase